MDVWGGVMCSFLHVASELMQGHLEYLLSYSTTIFQVSICLGGLMRIHP